MPRILAAVNCPPALPTAPQGSEVLRVLEWAFYLQMMPHFHAASEASCSKAYMFNRTKIESQHHRVEVEYKYTKIPADVATQCRPRMETEASWGQEGKSMQWKLFPKCVPWYAVRRGSLGQMNPRKLCTYHSFMEFLRHLSLVKFL